MVDATLRTPPPPVDPRDLGFFEGLDRRKMCAMAGPAERAREEIDRLAARGRDVAGFFDEAGRILRKSVSFDGFCSMTVDPATMLLTSHIAHDSVRPEDVPGLARNEFLEEDVNKFAVLARRPRPAGVLTDATAAFPSEAPAIARSCGRTASATSSASRCSTAEPAGAGSRSTAATRAAPSSATRRR